MADAVGEVAIVDVTKNYTRVSSQYTDFRPEILRNVAGRTAGIDFDRLSRMKLADSVA